MEAVSARALTVVCEWIGTGELFDTNRFAQRIFCLARKTRQRIALKVVFDAELIIGEALSFAELKVRCAVKTWRFTQSKIVDTNVVRTHNVTNSAFRANSRAISLKTIWVVWFGQLNANIVNQCSISFTGVTNETIRACKTVTDG